LNATEILPFSPGLLPAVQDFCERYWSRPRTEAYYDWRYLRAQPFSRMFLALRDGECLGMLYALRKPYRIGGSVTTCLEIFDWHSLPGQRGTGVGIRLMRAMMKQGESVLATGGTPEVLAMLPLMGWETIGAATRYQLPVSGDALASALQRRAPVPTPLARLAAHGVAEAGFFAPRRRMIPPDGRVERTGTFPEQVLELYRGDTGYGVVQVPDPDVLRWVTASAWSGKYEFLTFTVAGQLRGWAMTRLHQREQGLEGDIVELFAPRPDVAIYTWMLSEAAVSLLALKPRRLRARASCPILQAALEANRFRPVAAESPIHAFPRGVVGLDRALHVTLNHSDGPICPYETEPQGAADTGS
jgi:hypothetical protein